MFTPALRFCGCLALVTGMLAVASPARADTFLNYFFPSIFGPPTPGPKPEETLVAPFAKPPAEGVKRLTLEERIAKSRSSPENTLPVDQPHRSSKYISEWAAMSVADALSFDNTGYQDHLKKMDALFVPNGKQEFANNMVSSDLLSQLQAQQQRMQAFVKTTPTLLNEGNFGGVYRWLFDVPVTVSMIPSGMRTYSGKVKIEPVTRDLVIRIQVGRAQGAFTDGVAIERWTILGGS